ncbi:MAG: PEGA domain-containing protein [Deltaproteobacteria bacterium]|nr:MAG: PEGA domain-containing protein [Deltaproteobacteria bacterium]
MAVGEKHSYRLLTYVLIVSFVLTSMPLPVGRGSVAWADETAEEATVDLDDLTPTPETATEPPVQGDRTGEAPEAAQAPAAEGAQAPAAEGTPAEGADELEAPPVQNMEGTPLPAEDEATKTGIAPPEAAGVPPETEEAGAPAPLPPEEGAVPPPVEGEEAGAPAPLPPEEGAVPAEASQTPEGVPTPTQEAPKRLPTLFFVELVSDTLGSFELGNLNQMIAVSFEELGEYHLVGGEELKLRILQKYDADLEQKLKELDERINAGREKMVNGDMEGALVDLERAKALLEEEKVRQNANFDYSQVDLFLGSTLASLGKTEEAVEAYRRFMEKTPQSEILPETVPIEFIERFEELRAEHEQAPKGVVSIVSEPPFANVYLDGSLRGVTPLTIDNLTFGDHDIRIEIEDYKTLYAKVTIDSTELKSLSVTLQPNDGPQRFEQYVEEIRTAADPGAKAQKSHLLGDLLDVDYVVSGSIIQSTTAPSQPEDSLLGGVSPTNRYTLFLYMTDAVRGVLVRSAGVVIRGDFSDAEKKIRGLVGLFSQKPEVNEILQPFVARKAKEDATVSLETLGLVDALVAPEEEAPKAPKRKSIFQKWWFWTIVGGVAVAGATTGVILATQGNEGVGGSSAAVVFDFEL